MKTKELYSLEAKLHSIGPNGESVKHTWEVGQKVVLSTSMGEGVATITRITDGRGGTVYVGKEMFDASGSLRGGDTWQRRKIEPLTQEKYNEILAQNIREKLKRFNWGSLPNEIAIEIISHLRGKYPQMNFELREYVKETGSENSPTA